MDGILKLTALRRAYADVEASSNPARRFFDWSVDRSYPVGNPKAEPFTIDPGATLTLFSGLRTTAIDNTTEFALTLSPLSPVRYRFTWDTVGTAPALRTDRGIALSTHVITVTAQPNATVSFASGTVGDFAAVQPGDTLLIPDSNSTGDSAGPFSPANGGYWVVLSKDGTSTTLQLARPVGAGFTGVSEVVTVTSNAQVLAYSAAGVQVGDKVVISAGFGPPVLGSYVVAAVTPDWFEVLSTVPLPVAATAVPTASGMQFYSSGKRWVGFEADQLCAVRMNGDTTNNNQIQPWLPGDQNQTGTAEKTGPTWSVVVVNLSQQSLNLLFHSCE